MECAKQSYWKRVRKQRKDIYNDMLSSASNSEAKKWFHKIRRQHDKKVIQKQLKEHAYRYYDYHETVNIYSPLVYENDVADIHSWKEHNHKQKLKEAA